LPKFVFCYNEVMRWIRKVIGLPICTYSNLVMVFI
jgi:hypothetical protein